MLSDEQRKIMYHGLATKGRLVADPEEFAAIEERLKATPLDYYLWCARAVVCPTIEEAIESYSIALSIRPLSPHTLYNRGRKYMSRNQFAQAISDFKLATLLDPEDGWKWHFQGVALYFLERYSEAADTFRRAIAVNEKNGEPLLPFEVDWLWNCLCKLGDEEEAAACLELVTPETPVVESEKTYQRRILLYRELLSVEEYLAGIDPDDPLEAGNQMYGLANYYHYIKKDPVASVRYLKEVLANEPARLGWGYKMAVRDIAHREALAGLKSGQK